MTLSNKKPLTNSLASIDAGIAATIYYVGSGSLPAVDHNVAVAGELAFYLGSTLDATFTKRISGALLANAGRVPITAAASNVVANLGELIQTINIQRDADGKPNWRAFAVAGIPAADVGSAGTAEFFGDLTRATTGQVGVGGVNLLWKVSAMTTFVVRGCIGPEADTSIVEASARKSGYDPVETGLLQDPNYITPNLARGWPSASRLDGIRHNFDKTGATGATAIVKVYDCSQYDSVLLYTFPTVADATLTNRLLPSTSDPIGPFVTQQGRRIVVEVTVGEVPDAICILDLQGQYGEVGALLASLS